MSEYIKGDYTRCYEDICEIWYEDNLYCIVRTDDADKLIDVLNENEQLKSNIQDMQTGTYINARNIIRELKEENEQLKQQKDKWKQQCIHFKEMLDDMDIAYLCDEWIYEELKGDV